MTYKETLFFVGKCLTITHETKNKEIIEKELKSGNVDWDNIVKLSTSHYVFPALYCNLKRANFLHYLPNDLVEYMKHITDLNRERNQQIIAQAKEINDLLLANNITPIFLKGTGNLLEGLYEDIAERMVGDIDILTSKNQFNNALKILKNNGYAEKSENFIDNTFLNRHYPKITKKEKIGAIEVHYKMITNEKDFNYQIVKPKLKTIHNNINILSYEDQVLMTCFNKQLNDWGQYYKTISLRNSYDLYLLSKLTSVKKTLTDFKSPFSSKLNNFIASSSMLFNHPKSLDYTKSSETENFKRTQLKFINTPKLAAFNKKKWDLFFL